VSYAPTKQEMPAAAPSQVMCSFRRRVGVNHFSFRVLLIRYVVPIDGILGPKEGKKKTGKGGVQILPNSMAMRPTKVLKLAWVVRPMLSLLPSKTANASEPVRKPNAKALPAAPIPTEKKRAPQRKPAPKPKTQSARRSPRKKKS
jgi:hypothetical protein